MRQILLTRHAESEFNAQDRINSDPDIPCPLTERGEEQARALRPVLGPERIDLCATSEHERAIATADIALGARGIPRLVLAELNDPKAGDLEGGPASAYRARLDRDGPYSPNPGGESQIDALRRYVRAFRRLSARAEETILVVGHGTPLAWLREGVRLAQPSVKDIPSVDFGDPGVELAGPPERLNRPGLVAALVPLESFLGRRSPEAAAEPKPTLPLTLRDESFNSPAVRRLQAESEGQARLVYADTWDSSHEPSVDAAHFEPPGGRFMVAYSCEEPVACGGLRRLSEEAAEIKRLFVTAAARRHGVGSHLLHELERSARERGYRVVRLDTGARQPAALALFRSRGYREIADYNGSELAAHWFEKPLIDQESIA